MSIPESQLETWCNQGATVTSAAAYTSIKAALADPKSKVRELNPEIYLQGSYGNSTNIFADSDVDVAVQYNSVYDWDVSSLSLPQQMLFAAVPKVNHSWRDFHAQVVESLRSYYGVNAVDPGNKAIKVTLNSGRTVDVAAAKQYRKFTFFQSVQVESHVEGVEFQDNSGRAIINFPKEHIKNGEEKNALPRTATDINRRSGCLKTRETALSTNDSFLLMLRHRISLNVCCITCRTTCSAAPDKLHSPAS